MSGLRERMQQESRTEIGIGKGVIASGSGGAIGMAVAVTTGEQPTGWDRCRRWVDIGLVFLINTALLYP